MSSIKQMVKDGTIKRADALKITLADIHVEPGFNERTDGDALETHIAALTDYILSGGIVPALEVRPREGGGVWLVDGHCRHAAYSRAIAQGAPIEWIEVRQFTGNDADRIARIVSSNSGLPLTPLETSRVYKRLAAFGLSADDIARKVSRTRAHVDQMLILASANNDVHQMIAAGSVSAALAVEAVRKHGEGAGSFLAEQAGKAKAAGKTKVTAGTIAGKPLPRKIVDEMEATVQRLRSSLSTEAHASLATINLNESTTIPVNGAMLLQLIEVCGSIEDTRRAQALKAQSNAVKAAQTELSA
jgi:ParB family chromosome partitioning protein